MKYWYVLKYWTYSLDDKIKLVPEIRFPDLQYQESLSYIFNTRFLWVSQTKNYINQIRNMIDWSWSIESINITDPADLFTIKVSKQSVEKSHVKYISRWSIFRDDEYKGTDAQDR